MNTYTQAELLEWLQAKKKKLSEMNVSKADEDFIGGVLTGITTVLIQIEDGDLTP